MGIKTFKKFVSKKSKVGRKSNNVIKSRKSSRKSRKVMRGGLVLNTSRNFLQSQIRSQQVKPVQSSFILQKMTYPGTTKPYVLPTVKDRIKSLTTKFKPTRV